MIEGIDAGKRVAELVEHHKGEHDALLLLLMRNPRI